LCAVYFLREEIWCISETDFKETFYRMIQLIIKLETGYNCVKILVVPPDKDNEINECVASREEKKYLPNSGRKCLQNYTGDLGVSRNAIRMHFWTGPWGSRRLRLPVFLDNRHI